MANKQLPLWLLAISLLIGLIIPVLIQDGMFMDGVLYTSVAKNLANGVGTFWFPKFSTLGIGGLSNFHEHPPLVFGIQAIFFKILGNSIYTERFYSFFTACLTAFLIHRLWQIINKENESIKRLSWLPVIFWIIIPIAFWSYRHNMQENTMGIFTLLAVIFAVKSIKSERRTILFLCLSGCMIFLASLSKGVPGFFPITFAGIYWLAHRKISFGKMIGYSFLLLGVPVFIYALLMLYPDAKESLSTYLFKRALHRIDNAHTTDSRFFILSRLLQELLPSLLISLALILIGKRIKIRAQLSNEYKKNILLFLLLGIAGSFPLMLTKVQSGVYLVTSLPFFGIFFGLISAPTIAVWMQKIDVKSKLYTILKSSSILLLTASITLSILQIGKTSRDADALKDIYLFGEIIPSNSTVSAPVSMWNDWGLQTYSIRHYNISYDSYAFHEYFVIDKNDPTPVPKEYTKLNLNTLKYNLYKK